MWNQKFTKIEHLLILWSIGKDLVYHCEGKGFNL